MHKDHSRQIKVVKDVLDVNDRMAADNRRYFSELNLFVLNIMSSPGSGKTTLLQKTLDMIREKVKVGVIVGDVCTTNDAERLSLDGKVSVVQINTEPFGGDCHLAAHLVKDASDGLDLKSMELLIVENLGNLVCPAEFDIGQDKNIVMLSVTEGEDKPIKYPLMFRVSDLAILSKIDLLPHLDYDLDFAVKCMKDVHSHMPVIQLSAKSGEGMDKWIDWIMTGMEKKQSKKDAD